MVIIMAPSNVRKENNNKFLLIPIKSINTPPSKAKGIVEADERMLNRLNLVSLN